MKNINDLQKSAVEQYKTATHEQKKVLENIFGKDLFQPKYPTNFEEVLTVLNKSRKWETIISLLEPSEIAILKLKYIFNAINNIDGYTPNFENTEEGKYSFYVYNKTGLVWSVDDFCYVIDAFMPGCFYVKSVETRYHIIKYFNQEIQDFFNAI